MNQQTNLESNWPNQRLKNIWGMIAAIIITALIVGGSIYAWQKNELNRAHYQMNQTQKISNKQSEQIKDLREEISQLKDTLSQTDRNKTTTQDRNEFFDWETYIHPNEGYSIKHPSEFWPQLGHNIMNYDIDDSRYQHGNPDGIKIQIQKHALGSNFESFDEYIAYRKNISDEFTDPAQTVQLGNITLSQYTKSGPGGAFMVYTAFDIESNTYFDILIFEPGYSKNKELVEKMISTFNIL